MRLAVLRGDGSVIDGLDEERCVPLGADAVAHEVCWRGQAAAPPDGPAPGELIRLRVRAHQARLYSVAITGDGGDGAGAPAYDQFSELNPQRNHLMTGPRSR